MPVGELVGLYMNRGGVKFQMGKYVMLYLDNGHVSSPAGEPLSDDVRVDTQNLELNLLVTYTPSLLSTFRCLTHVLSVDILAEMKSCQKQHTPQLNNTSDQNDRLEPHVHKRMSGKSGWPKPDYRSIDCLHGQAYPFGFMVYHVT